MKIRFKLGLKRIHWVIIIGIMVCIAVTVVTAGMLKGCSGKKEAGIKKENPVEKEEIQESIDSPEGEQTEEELETEPGDREVTEVEVEEEELSKEEIEQIQDQIEHHDPSESTSPYYIKVNRLANCVTIYTKDVSGAYTVPFKAMICSVGKDINDTPTGVFGTYAKYTWRYLFGEQYGQYTTRIVGHILFHSVPYSKPQKDMLKTDYYNNLGIADSMGCIRLTVADAKWIYDNCPLGTTVEIYDDLNPGPLGKPSSIHIDPASPYAGWDPTDPDPANPWNIVDKSPAFAGVKNITVERGNTASLTAHVTATDFCGNLLNVSVTGVVDTNTCGQYPITYTAKDSMGNAASATAIVVVVDTTAPSIRQNRDITVYDTTADVGNLIRSALTATDLSQTLGAANIVVDTAPLDTARSNKAYGTVYCSAYAVDGSGNKSGVLRVKVSYVYLDDKAPEITVLEAPEITVDLAGAGTSEAKKQKILDAALAKVKEGKCFTAKDNTTPAEKLVFGYTVVNSELDLTGTRTKVTITVTAADEAGNTSAAEVTVRIHLQNNIVE